MPKILDDVLLKVDNLGKNFSGNIVLKDINFVLKKGEILGLVGENGAGKSTLMKILFGMPEIGETGGYTGSIYFNSKKLMLKSPNEALEIGIGMVHQEFSLIPGFNISENIKLNMEKTKPSILSNILGKRLDMLDI